MTMPVQSQSVLVRHEGETPRERSTCGWRDLLISRFDADVAAWAHAVDIDGARLHYHKIATARLALKTSCPTSGKEG